MPEPAAPKPRFQPAHVFFAGFGLLWITVGVLFLIKSIGAYAAQRDTGAWPSVRGEIVESTVDRGHARETPIYTPVVIYAYEVNGVRHESDTLRLAERASNSSLASARSDAERYPVGDAVDVRYDPADPARSVLQPGVAWADATAPAAFLAVAIIGLVPFGIGARGIYRAAARPRSRHQTFGHADADRDASPAPEAPAPSTHSTLLGRLFRLPIALGFGGFAALMSVMTVGITASAITAQHRQNVIDTWPTTEATITALDIDVETPEQNTQRINNVYTPRIEYVYKVDGVAYTSDRFGTRDPRTYNTRREAEERTRPYQRAETLRVRYDPDDPGAHELPENASENGSSMLLALGVSGFAGAFGVAALRLAFARHDRAVVGPLLIASIAYLVAAFCAMFGGLILFEGKAPMWAAPALAAVCLLVAGVIYALSHRSLAERPARGLPAQR